uniref:non-specific serine/threonine protein kinase n=1 Tax=Amphiprion ocellaris TaxID=80972 RepID=A0A3Q1CIS0_AMPOC
MNQDTTRKNSCTVHQPAGSSQDSRTRSLKRKASLDRTNSRKRTRVSEPVEPSTSDFIPVPSLSQEDEEKPSFHPSDTIPADPVRVNSDPLEGCSKHRQGGKRKASDAGEGPSRKQMRNQDLVVKEDEDKDERAQFEALYQEQYHLGEGGCGCVFAGYRKSDNLQVAIKHIPKDSTCYKEMEKNKLQLPTEVFIMLKLHNVKASGSVGSSAPIGLVDWFDLNQELILILERPVPSKDLLMYVWDNGASPEEDEAKIILKQLIDAAIHLENTNIFHRDIKMENILLETGSGVPRLRLIDFGLSCVVTERSRYQVFYGTPQHIPPEWYSTNTYTAGPTTVWQIGVVLFDMLHRLTRFDTTRFLDNELTVSRSLSEDCKDLLQKCFTENPEQRPMLKELRCHPWLR